MFAFQSLSLRQMLTIPYVLLVLATAATIGFLSYHTGKGAVDSLSDYLLRETVGRISQAVERHVFGSGAVLETAFPNGVPAPRSFKAEIDALRTRFWLATSVHRDPNNYAFYGDRSGNFFGLWRFSDLEAELRLRTDEKSPRMIYRFSGIGGELKDPRREERIFDPRDRPWYKAGQENPLHAWTSIYIDFKTLELVATRARRVNDDKGNFEGVVATDLSLKHLSDFLRQLKLSPNGFSFIVESDGNLVATSRGPHLRKGPGEINERLNAAASDDALMAAAYQHVRGEMQKTALGKDYQASQFETVDGTAVQVGFARVRDVAGLDWIVVVAVPRSDFLSGVSLNVKRTVVLSLLAALLILVIGYWVLHSVADDLKKLATAARNVGDGVLDSPLEVVHRNDEIGELAKSFTSMQQRLLTDRLTGLANREAALRRIEERIILHRRSGDSRAFALLFIDLNHFKQVNDLHGHDAGDLVLRTMGERMKSTLRGSDLVARYAGDEFLILLDSVDNRANVDRIRQSLEAKLAEPITLGADVDGGVGGASRPVTPGGASIGMALYPDDGQDVDSLVKRADAEMYERKALRK